MIKERCGGGRTKEVGERKYEREFREAKERE